ncbi:MAG: FAD-dependent oxidoreductase, partial [Planctomycetes bacterium]|nr:FAD-dependent oxidoreductase [Planctomycetota bacterium]
MSPHDPFATLHDVAVFGGGYAGLAAAAELTRRGRRVVLVERQAALAWESGWAFSHDAGSSAGAGWRDWLARLEAVGGLPGGGIDGAQAEIQAHQLARELGIALLFYAAPVALESAQGLVQGVVLGGKPGLRRLRARVWLDASEAGELVALAQPGWQTPVPATQRLSIHWRKQAWGAAAERSGAIAGGSWRFAASGWGDERV